MHVESSYLERGDVSWVEPGSAVRIYDNIHNLEKTSVKLSLHHMTRCSVAFKRQIFSTAK